MAGSFCVQVNIWNHDVSFLFQNKPWKDGKRNSLVDVNQESTWSCGTSLLWNAANKRIFWQLQVSSFKAIVYLRPSELLEITSQHLIPPSASRAKGVWGAIVGLSDDGIPTKAKEFDDCVLFNTSCRMDVNHVISALAKRKVKHGESVFHPLTLDSYSGQIQQAVDSLKLSSLDLTPHILRHSGASHDAYYEIRDIKQIQLRGRWKCLESVKKISKARSHVAYPQAC